MSMRSVAACLAVWSLLVAASARGYEPRINYMLQCMGCHAPDGAGEPGHVPPINSTLLPFARLTAGRQFMVRVPGAALSKLTDSELAALFNWMIPHLAVQKGQPFAPFTAKEVGVYRRTPLVDVTQARRRLLAQLPLTTTAPTGVAEAATAHTHTSGMGEGFGGSR